MSNQEQKPPTTTQPADCDQLREILPTYVIGGIDPEEKRLFEAQIEDCPEVAAELQEYLALSGALLYEAEPEAPPAHLHGQLMAAVQARETAAFPTVENPGLQLVSPPRRANRLWALAAIAALVALVATNVYWLGEVSQLQITHADVEALLQEERFMLAVLGAGQAQRVELHSTEEDSDAVFATVLWHQDIERALLYSDQLASLPSDRTYQLWMIGDETPVSAGIFQINEEGAGILVFTPPQELDNFDALGISDEPAGGSEAPTTTPLAVGTI